MTKITLIRGLGIILIMVLISLGSIGGCHDDDGGDQPLDAVLLGIHRGPLLDGLDAGLFEGKLNNIILDGNHLDDLTQEEKDIVREAYEFGFVIFVYDMHEARIAQLYVDILRHNLIFSEIDELDLPDLPIGQKYSLFAIEQHDGIDWTLNGVYGADISEIIQSGEFDFDFVVSNIREWIEAYESRRRELELTSLVEEGVETLITTSQEEVPDVRDITKKRIGTLQIQVGIIDGDFEDTAVVPPGLDPPLDTTSPYNNYQMTTGVWTITVRFDNPRDISSFVFVEQGMNLESSSGYIKHTSGRQFWYLSSVFNENTLQLGGRDLDFPDVTLLPLESPDTNQATTVTTTTSVSQTVTGTVGVGSVGPMASVNGGASWGSSSTFQKASVSINNISLSSSTGNDASWEYLPLKAQITGTSGTCEDFKLREPACLAVTTFKPQQGFVYQIDGKFANRTLALQTLFEVHLTKTKVGNCNKFGCSCKAKNTDGSGFQFDELFKLQIFIPPPPEGPIGDLTCSDGIDNDLNGCIDGADPNCGGDPNCRAEGPIGDITCSDGIDNNMNGLTDLLAPPLGPDPNCQ